MTLKRTHPLTLSGLLLLILAARTVYLRRLTDMTGDEAWSVWQTLGGVREILHWTPFDWPPGYYLIIGGWWRLTGLHSITLRYLMLLVFLIGVAGLYRAGLRLLRDERAALLAVMVFGALGWSIFGSMHLRGHSFTLSLSPLLLWFTLRYFDHPRWQRGVPMGVLMAFLLYIHTTTAVYFAMLGLFMLVVYGWRDVWRWWLPGAVMLVLAAPELFDKYQLFVESRLSGFDYPRPPFAEGMSDLYRGYWGRAHLAWWALVGAAVVMLLWRRRNRLLVGLAVWCAMPLLLWATHEQFALFFARYVLWYLTGLSLLVGWGLSLLPGIGRWGAGVALLVILFVPMNIKSYDAFGDNEGRTLAWIADQIQPGDVVVMDPTVNGKHEEFDLFARMFFPNGLPLAAEPGEARRVWYMQGRDAMLYDEVTAGRVPREFYGELPLLTRLYEAPPDPEGVLFENGMRFHGMDSLQANGAVLHRAVPTFHEDEMITVRLWWSVDEPLELDYSVGVYTMRDDAILASSDSAPQTVSLEPFADAPPPATSQWQPGQFYVEEREILIPLGARGVSLAVYQWWDNTRIPAPGTDEANLLPLTDVFVLAW